MSPIYISREVDPYFNIASEYQLLTEANEEVCLYLWQNQPCVVIGRNQNLYAECNMDYLVKNHILPVRRFSGGGAVFQDIGNVNFTFIAKEEYSNNMMFVEIIKKALSSFSIDCIFSGRNDLLFEGKKVSGHASYCENKNYMYHGTMMVNVNLDMLVSVLKPSYIKLSSKGINSVRSRVVNLSQINNNITEEKLKEAFLKVFFDVYGDTPIRFIDKENMQPLLYEKISQDKWIYGESPEFGICIEKKLSKGNVTIYAKVEDGIIKNIKIYTDSLLIVDIPKLEKDLIGTLYRENNLFEQIDKFFTNKTIGQNDFIHLGVNHK